MGDNRDIVERLLSRAWDDRHHRKYREEAAAEITRLRAEVERLQQRCAYWAAYYGGKSSDLEDLKRVAAAIRQAASGET